MSRRTELLEVEATRACVTALAGHTGTPAQLHEAELAHFDAIAIAVLAGAFDDEIVAAGADRELVRGYRRAIRATARARDAMAFDAPELAGSTA